MKRIVAFCIALLLCLGMFSIPAFSEEIQTAVGNKVVIGKPTSKDGALTPKSCVKIRFGKMPSKLELGQAYPIAWKVWYRYSFGAIYASTSNYNVISIQDGCLVPKSLGSAKITLRCDGKTTTRKFKVVLPKPRGVDVVGAVSIQRGETRQLSPSVYPSLAPQAVSFSSSNKKVAKVDKNGLITALKAGKATITVKAKKNSKAKATCLVTVLNTAADVVTRRGLVMGECSGRHGSYNSEEQKTGERLATVANVNGVFELLRKHNVSARTLVNPSTSASALEAIRSAFAGADSNDVSYLYINAHGGVSNNIFYMAIGSNGYTGNEILLSAPQLKAELDKVPGTKVVFLESCQSGSVIGKALKGGLQAANALQMTDAFIEAFKSSTAPKAGELAANGYYVLCSVSGAESSWFAWNSSLLGYSNFTGGLFTHGLTKGAGWDMMRMANVSAAADTNKDKAFSLSELYTYTYDTVEAAKAEFRRYGINDIRQVVQCYPNNSSYAVFTAK